MHRVPHSSEKSGRSPWKRWDWEGKSPCTSREAEEEEKGLCKANAERCYSLDVFLLCTPTESTQASPAGAVCHGGGMNTWSFCCSHATMDIDS